MTSTTTASSITTPYWRSECGRATVYVGDCREVLPHLEPDHFHAVCTDPPYELGFMSKRWDGTGVAYDPRTWDSILRVSRAGAYLLAFGGSRTYHRMTCAIEDAGYEIRDCIMWVYLNGYPKSMDVSKAIDKRLGVERRQVRTPMSPTGNVMMDGIGAKRPWKEAAKEVGYHEHDGDDPVTEQAKEWHGWGTTLKPAYEPIVLARKPLGTTVAECMLANGTGALNIDTCRIGTTGADVTREVTSKASSGSGVYRFNDDSQPGSHMGDGGFTKTTKDGRWPANLVHDGSEEVMRLLPDGADRFFKSFTEETDECHSTRPVSDVEQSFDATSETVASALRCAVDQSTQRLLVQSRSVQAQSTSVSESQLRLVCESVIETIQSSERRYWLGLPPERSMVRLGPVTCVATPSQTGTTSITINLMTSSHSVEVVTFNIMPSSKEHGEQDSVKGSRMFYTPKANSSDRPHGKGEGKVVHPTVKPLDLMHYMVKLVCVRGGTVLDPFMGTGSTGCAAVLEGMQFVGVELSREYADIAVGKIKLALESAPPLSLHSTSTPAPIRPATQSSRPPVKRLRGS